MPAARARFTQTELARAIKAADLSDPPRIVKVTGEGEILILPGQAESPETEVDQWLKQHDEGGLAGRA